MFIATANTLSTIHPALRDRMEVIDISGYLQEEKVEIARKHLIPKQLEENGVKKSQLSFGKPVIVSIAEDYTREAGVRQLEKSIAKVIRSKARFIAMGQAYEKKVSNSDLQKFLGPPRFQRERSLVSSPPGIATGLAWTSVGGEILFVETIISEGKGDITMTGNLGDVMKESARLAYEYLKAKSGSLGLNSLDFDKWHVHVHIPEGATPKDGPSAGITIFSALTSAFTQRKVRNDVAMTGEITLRGKVLPVGGIKEKILAARRAKVRKIILSEENRKDIAEIKKEYIEGLEFHYINDMIEAVDIALENKQAPVVSAKQ
jgi:ATP-dependent Lon protease